MRPGLALHAPGVQIFTLVPLRQSRVLAIEFSCDDSCSSSRVDDGVSIVLGRVMPKLESLNSTIPMGNPGRRTVKALITQGRGWLDFSTARVHFKAISAGDSSSWISAQRSAAISP